MNKKVKLRSLFIGGVFSLLFFVVIGRLYWVQVVNGAGLLKLARETQWVSDKTIMPVRGSIVDRNDNVLAEDAPAFTVALLPNTIQELHLETDVSKGLAAILSAANNSVSAPELEAKISALLNKKKDDGKLADQVEVRNEGWKIDVETADKVKELIKQLEQKVDMKKYKTVGIRLITEHKRYYPGKNLASHVIGYTDKQGNPAMGMEKQMDKYLKGVPGFLNGFETDRYGVELPDSKPQYQPAVNGDNVRLTIDKNIQFYMESALDKINQQFHPVSMTAIAVDPKTMEILGMANTPDFNPNQYWDTKKTSDFINHAVASQYEPGSTFKLVTLAGTVEEGLFNPNDTYQSGSIKVPGRTLHDYNITGWGRISYLEGLKRSSNVAFVKLGYEMLGEQKLRQYIDKFGFGAKTGVDIQGEVPGMINMKYPAEFATATYGQGLTATAIQQTAAYAAIANGGKLMWPHIIKDIYNPDTKEVVQHFEPRVIREVVSEKTAKQVSEYLEQVVSDQAIGTGKKAAIDGYRVAGKTGTANLVIPGEKGYAEGQWVISFVGYAPAEDPRILVTIIADRPDLGGDFHRGGDVAPPAFKEIVSQSLRYMGVAPSTAPKQTQSQAQQVQVNEKDLTQKAPDLNGQTLEQAKATMNKYGVVVEAIGKGDKVLAQSPAPGTEIGGAQRMYVVMQEGSDLPVPDLTGKSLRDAMEVCSFLKVKCQTNGEGYVTGQSLDGSGDTRVLTLQLKPYSEIIQGTDSGSGSGSGGGDKATGAKADKAVKTESVPAKTGSNAKSAADTSKAPGKTDGASKKAP
ncbi:penicillin-binding transpeptidase domain-containing protein [Paenibacillus filicis]|uniref:Penicillin-binding transpeptidase domain-containing protein n=1 Tax=Paenibacillus gyeongsangnamensis TaxID=3388067 RepID=A0ABT4Q2X3_9BACL|nr:penicillin-binding transpeptidase domain-containing protein [Paenibacillus filicis]MCZ8511227.1 penicillin-binding transpeptidase domain-containing protein [Paenibacillus filicis]